MSCSTRAGICGKLLAYILACVLDVIEFRAYKLLLHRLWLLCTCRTKLKQTEVDCEALKRCCKDLTEENRRLQKELQELRALKLAPPTCVISHDVYMAPLPAATLTMCPSCARVATVDNRAAAHTAFSKATAFSSHFSQSSAACT